MRIDENIVSKARTTDVLAFFEKYKGLTFKHQGGAYRCKEHPSLAIKSDRLSWYWHSKGIGGYGALDYLIKVERMHFKEAVETICSSDLALKNITPTAPPLEQYKPKTLILPEKSGIILKLYNYLCVKRNIDSSIVNTLIQNKMLYEDKRGNVVFVGYDEQNNARFASIRNTHGDFRGDCTGSDKCYSFNMSSATESEQLYIFESAIDAMSHAGLENIKTGNKDAWKQQHRISLSGTSDKSIPLFLKQYKTIKELVFCLDNDPKGKDAAITLAKKYARQGYKTRITMPSVGKDFNDDLQALKQNLQKQITTISR